MNQICSHAGVKYAFSLFIVAALLLTSCHTLSNRRDLYTPSEADGPWTKKQNGEPYTPPAAKQPVVAKPVL